MRPDDLIALIKRRRSVRAFDDRPVARQTVAALVDAARYAPSASNRQDWEFLAVESAEKRRAMAAAVREAWEALIAGDSTGVGEAIRSYSAMFHWFDRAPLVIVVTVKGPDAFFRQLLGERAGDISGSRLSAAMAAENLMLAAESLGLGSCCLTAPVAAEAELKSLLGISRRRHIVCLVALGYPASIPPAPERKAIEAILRFAD